MIFFCVSELASSVVNSGHNVSRVNKYEKATLCGRGCIVVLLMSCGGWLSGAYMVVVYNDKYT